METADCLTVDMLRKAKERLTQGNPASLVNDITVSYSLYPDAQRLVEPEKGSIFYWPCVRVWTDRRLRSDEWHIGKPREPIADA